jgi:hypothetical protein
MVLAGRQEIEFGRREEYLHRLQHAQNTFAELQHDIYRLNNILDPIAPLDVEEEDPDILIEDDGWEEFQVEPEENVEPMEDNDDDPMSEIDSDHSDKHSSSSD